MNCSKTFRTNTIRLLVTLAFLARGAAGVESVARDDIRTVVQNGLAFLRTQQGPDGSFGSTQPQLQAAAGILALLSAAPQPSDGDRTRVANGVRFLLENGSAGGDIGDDAFRTESQALALTALLAAWPHLEDDELRADASRMISRGLRTLQRWQDRSSSSASRGGWKMEGNDGRQNDRRATAWALLALRSARLYGLDVKDADMDRAIAFLLASQTLEDEENPDQAGGLSVDTEGLSVASISAMGGWVLQWRHPGDERAALNVEWLSRHPPAWSGPNYFYANVFRLRALHRAQPAGEAFERALRSVYLQIRENQDASGAIAFPPGNAQNTVAMGSSFSTAMAVLILNVESSALVFDQDFRVQPLF